MQVVNGRDRNTRGLAKIVSAVDHLEGECASAAGIDLLNAAKRALLHERRALGASLLRERDKQADGWEKRCLDPIAT